MSSQGKIQCSVPILTLNSAPHLEQCLTSVRNFSDVFLLDGNSTDETLAIARALGIPVHKQLETDEPNVRIRDFTAMRIKGESLARCDWIFGLDADEYISPELERQIREALALSDIHRVFSVPKVAIMGHRTVRHSFNTPDHAPRLYHKKSGVCWKSGKLVHEKLSIPPNVRRINLSGEVYAYAIDSYREAVLKDNRYLALTRKKMFAPGQSGPVKRAAFRSLWLNFLRAGNVLYKSLKVYLRHGFKESLPPLHVWRYVRYHLVIAWYCGRKLVTYP